MNLEELLAKLKKTPEFSNIIDRELQDLVAHHLELSWSDLHLKKSSLVSAAQEELIDTDLLKLKSGVPLAYILGQKFFYKNEFFVNPDVLIPRPETEIIVEMALDLLEDQSAKVMDLGAGSGCIGLSIALESPGSKVFLVEASHAAMAVMESNQKRLSATNSELIRCELGVETFPRMDLYGQIDLIVSNPPYICHSDSRVSKSVHQFEPHQALYAPENGLFWIHKFIVWSYDYLVSGGFLIIEFGRGQEGVVGQLVQKMDYSEFSFINDLTGNKRFIKLKK